MKLRIKCARFGYANLYSVKFKLFRKVSKRLLSFIEYFENIKNRTLIYGELFLYYRCKGQEYVILKQ